MAFFQTSKFNDLGLLILRLAAGGMMIPHGWQKLNMIMDGNADKFGDPIGLGTTLSAYLATGAEFFAAILIVIGLLTRFAAVPLLITMLVAAFIVHGGLASAAQEALANTDESAVDRIKELTEEVVKQKRSMELPMLYAATYLVLLFTGPGAISLDAKLNNKLCMMNR